MKNTTSERLQMIMRERDLKQVDVLSLCKPYCDRYLVKIGKSDLSQFVSGKVQPGQWKLTILSMALDVSEGWLMGLDVPMEREKELATENGSELEKMLSKASDMDVAIFRMVLSLSDEDKEKALSYCYFLAAKK